MSELNKSRNKDQADYFKNSQGKKHNNCRSDREIMITVLKELHPDEANCCEEDLEQLIDEYSEMILTTIRNLRKYGKQPQDG